MSHELFEFFGLLGSGIGLTALFHRAVQPVLLRFAGGAVDTPPAAGRRPAAESEA